MLQFSRATDYALLFLTHLVKRPSRHWSVRQASDELNISRRFLANIVHQLARGEIVTTSKGAGGGVTLRRSPKSITLKDVVEIFEGSLALVHCQGGECECIADCTMQGYWALMRDRVLEDLSTTTIHDLGGN